MKILDATCGARGMWYIKKHPLVTYMDKREGVFINKKSYNKFKNVRRTKIKPDVVSEWKDAPFPDEHFDCIIFDPPFHIEKRGTKEAGIHYRYGRLYKDNWNIVLGEGIKVLFDKLKPEGLFIFKWCENNNTIPIEKVLKLFPYKPTFGTKTGQHNHQHWIVFIKYSKDKRLTEFIEG